MFDSLSGFVGAIWTWLNTEQYAGALSALLAVLTLAGGVIRWLRQRTGKTTAPAPTGGNDANASGDHSTAIGRDANGATIINNHGTINHYHGPTQDQIDGTLASLADVKDLSEGSEAKAIDAAAQLGVISREALIAFFTILKQQPVAPDQLTAKLVAIAQQHIEMVERLATLEQAAEPDDRPILTDARAAIDSGDYDRAERLFVSLEDAQAAAHAKAQANADALARRQAATRAKRARLSALRLDYRAAADHFLAAANLLPVQDTEAHGGYLTDSADALQQYGRERGDNDALRRAIARYREALPPRDHHPALWALIQNNLGNALSTLGQREGGTERLTESVEAYRSALSELIQEPPLLKWAATQNNLGSALAALGELERSTERLTQAVEAFQDALRVRTQKRAPHEWAATQNNLGNALRALGALDERESGIRRLTEAVEAFQNALRVRTQERTPLNWAMTQSNMGNALGLLAKRNRDVDSAKQSVAAQEAALEMFTRLNASFYIEGTTKNLALARATLAELEGGADDSPPHQ